jgi:hypothetical protein
MKQVMKTMIARLDTFTAVRYENYVRKLGLSFLLLGLGLGLSSCRNNSSISAMEELERLRIEVEAASKEAQEAKKLANQCYEKQIHQTTSAVSPDATNSPDSADNQPSTIDIDKKIEDAVQDALNKANIAESSKKAVEEAVDKANIDQKVQKAVDEKMNTAIKEVKGEIQGLQKKLEEISTTLGDTLKDLKDQDVLSGLGDAASKFATASQEAINNIKDKFTSFFNNKNNISLAHMGILRCPK